MFYLIVILVTDLVAILQSGFLTDASWGWVVLGVLAETVGVIAFDGLQAWIIRWFPLPKRWFSPESRAFRTPGWERKLYRKLKIGKWKRLVPELGGFTDFHKDKLQSTSDADYLRRFILENNYGTAIHLTNAVLGFVLLALPFWNRLTVALPIAVVNAVLSLMPYMILRYNTPPLVRLYVAAKKKEAQAENVKKTETDQSEKAVP